MALTKRVEEKTTTNDIYYVSFEEGNLLYFINDDVAFDIEREIKDQTQRDRALRNGADLVIDTDNHKVIKSRWF